MSRSSFTPLILLVSLCLWPYSRMLSQNESPNVLLVMVDDLADWVGCMGGYPGNVHTPNIDRLAKRGVLFTNAHCTSPICGPSRAAILTGLRPEVSGVFHNKGNYSGYTDAVGFPLYFRQNGYEALGAGKINHGYGCEIVDNWDEYGPDTRHIGGPVNEAEMSTKGMDPTKYIKRFDVTLPQNTGALIDRPANKYSTWDYCGFNIPDSEMPDGKIALWGVGQLQKTHKKSFLLACGFYRPHQPFYVPQKYFDMYDMDDVVLPTTIAGDLFDVPEPGHHLAHAAWTSGKHATCIKHQQWKPLVRGYLAAISFADAQLGKLIDALDNGVHTDNTWIVLVSDHGWHLGEKEHWGKHTPWMNSTKVPFIIVPPKGEVMDGFKAGTICNQAVNLLDVYPTLIDMTGLPQKEQLGGKSLLPLINNPDADWDEATVTTIAHGNHAIHTKQWSYIHYYDDSEELYNIVDDPEQWVNLASNLRYQTIIERLKKYIPEGPYKQFVRYGNWKACIRHSGAIELYSVAEGTGVAEQVDVAKDHPEMLVFIKDFLKTHQLKQMYCLIPEE